jgi:hypothetical protein
MIIWIIKSYGSACPTNTQTKKALTMFLSRYSNLAQISLKYLNNKSLPLVRYLIRNNIETLQVEIILIRMKKIVSLIFAKILGLKTT